MKSWVIWWFLFSVQTMTGSTIDFRFDDFATQQECAAFREALIAHGRPPHGFSATVCQAR